MATDILTVPQVAEHFQCTERHVYNLFDKGLRSFKVGGSRRVRRSAIEAFITQQEKKR